MIKQAKQILNTTSCKIALTGTDAPGNETNQLTQYTVYALRCYQGRHNLAITGDLTPATWDVLVTEPGATQFVGSQTQGQQGQQQQQGGQEEQGGQQQGGQEEQEQTYYTPPINLPPIGGVGQTEGGTNNSENNNE